MIHGQLSAEDMKDLGDLLDSLRNDIHLSNRESEIEIREAMMEILENKPVRIRTMNITMTKMVCCRVFRDKDSILAMVPKPLAKVGNIVVIPIRHLWTIGQVGVNGKHSGLPIAEAE